MAQSAPTKYVWVLGLILGLLGIIGHFIKIPFVTEYNYILLLIGFTLLALGTMFKGV
jgi:hypothetical protein